MPKENNTLPKSSAIKNSGFTNFLSTLFGWRKGKNNTVSSKNVEFTQVDLGAKDQRINQAFLNRAPNLKGALDDKLESLFNRWLSDNTDKMSELSLRTARMEQLEFMVQNDPVINRVVDLYADESCQLDAQDTLISIETPDPRMTLDMYKLLNQWGITQNRLRETIRQLAIYGDAFWANTVTEKGIERIRPLSQNQVLDRLEFSPVKVMEMRRKREGYFSSFASNNYLIEQMLNSVDNRDSFSDLFDTKLFGFSIDKDFTVPPWNITHFRVGGEGSQFYPWGTSPIIGALAPFKQTQSAITLQALSRELNFPITTYEVKTDPNMDEVSQFATINRVREAFDNIGVNAEQGNSEVYTVNTKIWLPKDLVTVTVHKAEKAGADSIDDIKLYQSRVALACAFPQQFYGDEGFFKGGINNSGKSLIQQYKPFGRKCYSLQNSLMEGLADSFRLHFAITGAYDFRIPFTLSMKYPVLEEDSSVIENKKGTLSLADDVIKFVKSVIGATEEEPLPADIMRDIVGKYSFLEPADILKWTRDARYYTLEKSQEEGEGDGDIPELDEPNFGSDISVRGNITPSEPSESEIPSSPSSSTPSPTMEETPVEEKKKSYEQRLREYESVPKTQFRKLREQKLKEKYNINKDRIYFEALERCGVNNFTSQGLHTEVFNTLPPQTDIMLEVLSRQNSKERLKESTFDKGYYSES